LKEVINQAGFNVTPASFFDAHPEVCEKTGFLELETASGRPLKMYCLDFLQKEMAAGRRNFCMVVLNHDLTKGIPQILLDLEIPIFPSFRSGWHARSKAHHFSCANGLIHSFSKMIDEDPWHFSCLFETVDEVDINIDSDRENLERATQSLMDRISEKYAENGISEKPFVFMKSDSGTYGMAIHIIEDAADIRSLNRKARNKLAKGKQGKETNRFILQEGIPSNTQIDGQTSELCIYQIENHYLGGFYRVNEKKNDRGNLNSDGMSFRRMCETHAVDQNCATQPGANLLGIQECGRQPDPHVQIDRILARIAGIAASIEVKELIEGVRR
jgi:glutamate--cysteine ligase